MAGLDANTDSYVKPPALPAQKSVLDQVGQYQQLESGGLTISKQKLELINTQFGLMNQELSTLANDPSITKEQAAKRLTTFATTYKFPPEVTSHMMNELQQSKDVPTFAKTAALRGLNEVEKINKTYGTPGMYSNGQTDMPVVTSPMLNGGVPRQVGVPIQRQIPVDTPVIDPNTNQPTLQGPTPAVTPPGTASGPRPLPSYVRPVQTTPIAPTPPNNFRSGLSTDTPNNVVQNRANGYPAPSGPATGLPPGVKEAASTAGTASGAVLAAARARASNFQRDIFPLAQAIPALEKLGTKGSGPGTETFNHIRSFILSNVPGTTEKTFDDKVKTFDEAKKYLTDFVNQTGNSGTNDKLAAAFAGNPSVGISNAAASDVAKSAMALRRMQQTRDLSFEDSGLPPDQASKFFANGEIKFKSADGKDRSIRIQQLDPRAFGVDLMSDKAKKNLLDQLNKNPREKDLFDKSAELAIQHGYLTPK